MVDAHLLLSQFGHGGCSYRCGEPMHQKCAAFLIEEIASQDAESDKATAAKSAA
jgi:hypothetical protein